MHLCPKILRFLYPATASAAEPAGSPVAGLRSALGPDGELPQVSSQRELHHGAARDGDHEVPLDVGGLVLLGDLQLMT